MSDDPALFAAPPPVSAPPPAHAPLPPPGAQSDTSTLLVIGAVGAFATAAVFAMQFLPMGKLGQGVIFAQAVLAIAGLIGMGIGFLGFASKTGVRIAKTAGILLFVCAIFALLPILVASLRSRELRAVLLYATPIISAITWILVAQSLLGARQLLGGIAGAIGWTLMVCALLELVIFFVSVKVGIRSRSIAEIVQTVLYVSVAARMLAFGGVGAMLLRARRAR